MAQLSQAIVVLIAAALAVILVEHGPNGLRAKASAVFLGRARPDLIS